MNVLVPMAGLGSRFSKAGFDMPKPFIDVMGRPMIERVLENLSMPHSHYILVARGTHVSQFGAVFESLKRQFNCSVVAIDATTEGTACTALAAHRLINDAEPLLIANSDQIVDLEITTIVDNAVLRSLDGSILTFKDMQRDPKWSYARLGRDGLVTEVREKEAISDNATVGIYYFRQGRFFVDAAIDMLVANDRVNNEFYTCPVYNYLIREKRSIGIYEIGVEKMHGLGTPEDLAEYLSRYRAV